MSLVKCQEPGCTQLLEASCEEIVTLFRIKTILENVKFVLPANSELSIPATEELKKIEEKIKQFQLEDEDLIRDEFKKTGFIALRLRTKTSRVLTLKCMNGHSHKYIVNCP